jgi:hypothetical protein
MRLRRMILCGMLAMIAVAMMSCLAPAFCPMCKTVVEGATGAQEMAGSLNLAALVLMAPPVILFAALFGLFYRLRNAGNQPSAPAESGEEIAPPRALTD